MKEMTEYLWLRLIIELIDLGLAGGAIIAFVSILEKCFDLRFDKEEEESDWLSSIPIDELRKSFCDALLVSNLVCVGVRFILNLGHGKPWRGDLILRGHLCWAVFFCMLNVLVAIFGIRRENRMKTADKLLTGIFCFFCTKISKDKAEELLYFIADLLSHCSDSEWIGILMAAVEASEKPLTQIGEDALRVILHDVLSFPSKVRWVPLSELEIEHLKECCQLLERFPNVEAEGK